MTQIEYTPAEIARFWTRVNKNGPVPSPRPDLGPCWLWTGRINPRRGGYGDIWADGRNTRVHRFSYLINVGPIAAGLLIMHLCDVRPCVRPSHLSPGTPLQNMQDKIAKGRGNMPSGLNHYRTRFSPELVARMVAMRDEGALQREIGAVFGVNRATVSKLLRRASVAAPDPRTDA